jgi:hypothetical protein
VLEHRGGAVELGQKGGCQEACKPIFSLGGNQNAACEANHQCPRRRRRQAGALTLEAAYDHFRLERQGDLVSPATLEHYDAMVVPFLTWVSETAAARRFEDVDVGLVRAYRAELAVRPGKKHGRLLQARTIFDSHRALLTFFRWA